MSSPAGEGPAPTRRLVPGARPGARLFGSYVLLGRGEPEPDEPCLAFRADEAGGRLCRLVMGRAFASEDERARWRSWAEKLLALEHPHVLKIWAAGEHEGVPFMEEELVEGRELAALVRSLAERQTPMRNPVALLIARDVAETLAQAYGAGVVHGELDARRILLTYEGEVKVRGWRFTGGPPSADQASADLQRVCVLLWELLSHRPAPRNDLAPAAWPKPSQFNPDVPPVVDKLVAAALLKGETHEVSAEELARDLDRVLIVGSQARHELTRLMHSLPRASAAEQAALAAEIAPWVAASAGSGPARVTPVAATVRLPGVGATDGAGEPPRAQAAQPSDVTTAGGAAAPDEPGDERASRRRNILLAGGLGVVVAAAAVVLFAGLQPATVTRSAVAHAGTVSAPNEARPDGQRPTSPSASPPSASPVPAMPIPVPAASATPGSDRPSSRPVIEPLPPTTSPSADPGDRAASPRRRGPPARSQARAPTAALSPESAPASAELVAQALARGRRALGEGHADEAVAAAREAVAAGGGAPAYSLLGQAHFAKGAYAVAAGELRRALALDPSDSRAARRLRWLEESGKAPAGPAPLSALAP